MEVCRRPFFSFLGSSRALLQGERGQRCDALLWAPSWDQCHHVGQSWAGVVTHGSDGAHGLLPQLHIQALGGLLLQQHLWAQQDGMGHCSVPCLVCGARHPIPAPGAPLISVHCATSNAQAHRCS